MGDMFSDENPGKMDIGLWICKQPASTSRRCDSDSRNLGFPVVWFPGFDWEDHDSYDTRGIRIEDPIQKPFAVDFGTTPVLVTLF